MTNFEPRPPDAVACGCGKIGELYLVAGANLEEKVEQVLVWHGSRLREDMHARRNGTMCSFFGDDVNKVEPLRLTPISPPDRPAIDEGVPTLWKPMDGSPHPGLGAQLVILEWKHSDDLWSAYGLYKQGETTKWLGTPFQPNADVEPVDPPLAFDYWMDHVTNGYTYVVSGYWVRSRQAAENLLTLHQEELAAGAIPYPIFESAFKSTSADAGPTTDQSDARESSAGGDANDA